MSRKIVIEPNIRTTSLPFVDTKQLQIPSVHDFNLRAKLNGSTYENQSSYWKMTFLVVLLPFVVIGLPVHIIIPTSATTKLKRTCLTLQEWFHFRFSTGFVTVMTLILLPLWGCVNFDFGRACVIIINCLVIKGEYHPAVGEAMFEIVYTLPYFLMVNYAWLRGHELNLFLESFDAPTMTLQVTAPAPFSTSSADAVLCPANGGEHPKQMHTKTLVVEPRRADKSCRKTLVRYYIIVIVIHVLNCLLAHHRINAEQWPYEQISSYIILYLKSSGYTLIFPVYITLCGAIGCHVTALSGYIQSCIIHGHLMTRNGIYLIKKSYERIADSIVRTNGLFSTLLLVLFVVFAFFLLVNSMAVNSGAALKIIIIYVVEYLMPILKSFIAPTTEAGGSTDDTATQNSTSTSGKTIMTPDEIRYVVGLAVQIVLSVYVLWMTLSAAIQTNDKARYLQVWLNDFACETCSPEAQKRAQRVEDPAQMEHSHREFTFLKYYLHSRMEVQAELQRALLTIRGLGIFAGFLAKRLNGYTISH